MKVRTRPADRQSHRRDPRQRQVPHQGTSRCWRHRACEGRARGESKGLLLPGRRDADLLGRGVGGHVGRGAAGHPRRDSPEHHCGGLDLLLVREDAE